MVLALNPHTISTADTLEAMDAAQLLARSVQIGTTADDGGTAARVDEAKR